MVIFCFVRFASSLVFCMAYSFEIKKEHTVLTGRNLTYSTPRADPWQTQLGIENGP